MNRYFRTFFVILISILAGAVTGVVCTVFTRGLEFVTEVRTVHFIPLVFFLPLAGLLIVFCYKKFGAGSDKGMSIVFGTAFETAPKTPARLAPFIIVATWITHLFGGSAGREGAAVQIGASISDFFRRLFRFDDYKKVIIIAGMSAGFAGLFRTPITAIFFALEVMTCGVLEYSALLPAVCSAYTACAVSGLLGVKKAAFAIPVMQWDIFTADGSILLLKLIALGILFGLAGAAFSYSLKYCKKLFAWLFKNPYVKVASVGAFLTLTLILCHYGRYSGLGETLINGAFGGEEIYCYDFILKLLFTVLTLSAGFQGGEVTPLFSIGTTLGFILGPLFGFSPLSSAAFGYASVFGAATNTMIAPMLVGCEIFGFEHLPFFAVTVIVARLCNGHNSIYGAQKTILEK